ncbi:MAG: 30S ribosomal protein S21 [bacterium]|nr:30S ribosomal protein S21 [bacterium]
MPKVRVRKDEPIDKALRRLKRKMDKEGIIRQIRQLEHFEKPSQKKRRKMLKAKKDAYNKNKNKDQ